MPGIKEILFIALGAYALFVVSAKIAIPGVK